MARPKVNEQTAYQMAFEPLILKELIIDCGISQTKLGEATKLSRASINLTLNRGYIPVERQDFKAIIEKELIKKHSVVEWLADRQMQIADIWQPLGKELRRISPAGRGKRILGNTQTTGDGAGQSRTNTNQMGGRDDQSGSNETF